MDDQDKVAILGLSAWGVMVIAICSFVAESWTPLVILGYVLAGGLAVAGLIFLGLWLSWLTDALILRNNRRKDRAEEAVKASQEAREALVERALTQHVLLETGLIDNRPDKIAKGIHGDYIPHRLDWPERLSA
jgi:hypothetical protein